MGGLPFLDTPIFRQGPYQARWAQQCCGGRTQSPRGQGHRSCLLSGDGCPGALLALCSLVSLGPKCAASRGSAQLLGLPRTPAMSNAVPPHARREDRRSGWRRDGAWGVGSRPPAPCPLALLSGTSCGVRLGEAGGWPGDEEECSSPVCQWVSQPCSPLPPTGLTRPAGGPHDSSGGPALH